MPRVAEIADFLGVPLLGPDITIDAARSLQSVKSGAIVFLARELPGAIERLNRLKDVACVTTATLADQLMCSTLVHPDPRLAFCLLLERFFVSLPRRRIETAPVVASDAEIAADIAVGNGSVIGSRARIGVGTQIGSNVIIAPDTVIGAHCVIKSNTTIGENGFGFVRDLTGRPVRFPHIGNVRIGDRVEIGANCTVVRASLDTTKISDDVKTDDHVHIAHNDRIGARTLIAAGAILSGSVTIGFDVWIGPNATVIDYVSIGDGARIGLGSVVTRSVGAGETVFGNPARRLGHSKQDTNHD